MFLRSRLARPVLAPAIAGVLMVAGCGFTPPNPSAGGGSTTAGEQSDALYHGTVLSDQPRSNLRLRTTSGQWFDLRARPRQEATAVFFGYTHCPDVCPTTMADLGAAYRQLEVEVQDEVTVVFVTEDPERDTPRALRRWLNLYDEDFVGLIGGPARTASVLEQLHLPKSKIDPEPEIPIKHPLGHRHDKDGHRHAGGDSDYGVGHSGTVYLFGPDNRTRIYTGGTTPAEYADDLIRVTS